MLWVIDMIVYDFSERLRNEILMSYSNVLFGTYAIWYSILITPASIGLPIFMLLLWMYNGFLSRSLTVSIFCSFCVQLYYIEISL
jgi:hypothetical protein